MKFLIIRFSSIGDIVLTTPVVRCLKNQIATAEVHYLTKESFKNILAANPFIDKLHLLRYDLDSVIEQLKKEDFDYVIDLHHNLRTWKVKRALGKKAFSFKKLNIEKWLLTAFKINNLPPTHIVDRYMATLKSFGVKNDGAGLDYFIPKNEVVNQSDIPASHHAGYIAVVIGAAYETKKFPLHKLKELSALLVHPMILLGGPEDREDGSKIAAADEVKIYNACGKFSLNESADLIRRAKLIVTNDTGLMHIAAAFKRPIISLWGNTVPEFGMYPYYGENYTQSAALNRATGKLSFDIMEIKNLSCRPCSKIGYHKCPKGHFKCMELISTNELEKKVYEFININK
jgi:ADP-heptose:LPS heptosyltransferase